jgi:hypothetical protein
MNTGSVTYDTEKFTLPGGTGDIDGNLLNDFRAFPVGPYVTGTIQAVAVVGAWATAVLTIERSNDGATWVATSPSATTIGASTTMTGTIDVSGINFLRARVSTGEGAALTIKLVACFKGDA